MTTQILPGDVTRCAIRCAVFDRFFVHPTSVPPSAVFFYDRKLDDRALADALEEVLRDFYPFTARLRTAHDELLLECGQTGVSFSVEHRPCTMGTAMSHLFDGEAHRLSDRVGKQPGDPLLTVRVTHFTDDTSSIGMCWHHVVGDLHSLMMLMKAWSAQLAGASYQRPLVVEDRCRYEEESLKDVGRAKATLRRRSVIEHARRTLYGWREATKTIAIPFATEELDTMRREFQGDGAERLSANDVLCAHMLSLVAEWDPVIRRRYLSVMVNHRSRTGLPTEVLGNFFSTLDVACEPDELAPSIARRVRRGLEQFAEHFSHYANIQFVNDNGGVRNLFRMHPRCFDPLRGNLFVNSWSRQGAYEITFGGSRPVFFCSDTQPRLPWTLTAFDGFEGKGQFIVGRLPRRIAEHFTSRDGLLRVHRYRPAGLEAPPIARRLSSCQELGQ